MAAGRGADGTDRVLLKLRANVDAGNYYEAHQMYRSLYFRYCNKKKYAELLDLLYDGAVSLLTHQQFESGADLSILVIDVLNQSKTPVSDDRVEKLGTLFSKLKPESEDRTAFFAAALKWSSQGQTDYKYGHPRLHQHAAHSLWMEKCFARAHYHYLRSTDGEGFASMLIEHHTTKGFAMEEDLFIAQAVLQILCLQNKSTASVVFFKYTEAHPSVDKGPPYLQPLLNFLWFLLLAIESGKLAVFTVLCEKYQNTLKRDPTYSQYLDRIGQLFFGIPPPKKPSNQGFIGNLIQSLMGDDENEMNNIDDASTSMSNAQFNSEELD